MMPGMIMLWYGSIASIPSGWHICDGTMGTPDLRNKFVFGGGSASPPGTTGGEITHVHNFTGDGHAHDIGAGDYIQAGADYKNVTTQVPAVGTTDFQVHLPPYHVLGYIMKL